MFTLYTAAMCLLAAFGMGMIWLASIPVRRTR